MNIVKSKYFRLLPLVRGLKKYKKWGWVKIAQYLIDHKYITVTKIGIKKVIAEMLGMAEEEVVHIMSNNMNVDWVIYDKMNDYEDYVRPNTNPHVEDAEDEKIKQKFEDGKKTISGRAKDYRDLMQRANLQEDEWVITKLGLGENEWDVHMKMKEWDGEARYAHTWPIKRTNKQFWIKLELIPVCGVEKHREFKELLMRDVDLYSPICPKLEYPKRPEDRPIMPEFFIPDAHIGRFIWSEITGDVRYNSDMAIKGMEEHIDYLLGETLKISKNIDYFLIPLGNDLITTDYDYPFPHTKKGTPQQIDSRWEVIYIKVRMLCIRWIEKLLQYAPVKIIMIRGNHDPSKMFVLGDGLSLYFHNNVNVEIDNTLHERKYEKYGNSLIGFHHSHGGDALAKRLYTNMETDRPKDWATTNYHEWHVGHSHKQRDVKYSLDDIQGTVFRRTRSFALIDDWEGEEHYVRQTGSQCFIWDREEGRINDIYKNRPTINQHEDGVDITKQIK
jgi:ribosomal protein S24E